MKFKYYFDIQENFNRLERKKEILMKENDKLKTFKSGDLRDINES